MIPIGWPRPDFQGLRGFLFCLTIRAADPKTGGPRYPVKMGLFSIVRHRVRETCPAEDVLE